MYTHVMGVTGTYTTLSKPEKRVLKKAYKISDFTVVPSVYGKHQLEFPKATTK